MASSNYAAGPNPAERRRSGKGEAQRKGEAEREEKRSNKNKTKPTPRVGKEPWTPISVRKGPHLASAVRPSVDTRKHKAQ